MIYFNTFDDKLPEIKEKSKLRSVLTKEDFRVYGLRQADNPPILIEFSINSDVYIDLSGKVKKLQKFFANNGISIEEAELEHKLDEDGGTVDDFKIYIGLRKDIRDNVELCAAILQTIVLFLDGAIELDVAYKIPNIPKFEN